MKRLLKNYCNLKGLEITDHEIDYSIDYLLKWNGIISTAKYLAKTLKDESSEGQFIQILSYDGRE